ncbi:MAG: hypothetical protein WCP39_06075 [Chlamydiota bacterium]
MKWPWILAIAWLSTGESSILISIVGSNPSQKEELALALQSRHPSDIEIIYEMEYLKDPMKKGSYVSKDYDLDQFIYSDAYNLKRGLGVVLPNGRKVEPKPVILCVGYHFIDGYSMRSCFRLSIFVDEKKERDAYFTSYILPTKKNAKIALENEGQKSLLMPTIYSMIDRYIQEGR